jgi:hypothetical protein
MEYTEPNGLYTINEFKLRVAHTIENIKGIFTHWVIENKYEMDILRAKSFGKGFTPRQFANITGSLCNEIIKLTSIEYCDWVQFVAGELYRLINEEIERLGTENILENYTDNQIYELIMNIVRENLHEGEGSMIYCLIKV